MRNPHRVNPTPTEVQTLLTRAAVVAKKHPSWYSYEVAGACLGVLPSGRRPAVTTVSKIIREHGATVGLKVRERGTGKNSLSVVTDNGDHSTIPLPLPVVPPNVEEAIQRAVGANGASEPEPIPFATKLLFALRTNAAVRAEVTKLLRAALEA